MFDSSSSGYRRLSGRGSVPLSRNVTFFVILIVLVVFVSLFYLYLSASSELTRLRQECDSQGDYVLKLKNELLETNVNVEKLRASETECTNAKNSLNTKFEECSSNLKKKVEQVDEYVKVNTENHDTVTSLKKQIENLTATIEEQKVNISAMEKVGINQQAVIVSLNETVDLLRKDLALKDSLANKQKEVAPLLANENSAPAVVDGGTKALNSSATTQVQSGVLGDNAQPQDNAATTTTLSSNLEKALAGAGSTSTAANVANAFHDSPVDPKPGARVELEEKKEDEEEKAKEQHEQLVEAAQQNADEDTAKEEKDDFVDDKL